MSHNVSKLIFLFSTEINIYNVNFIMNDYSSTRHMFYNCFGKEKLF